jgi:hypothetical protein
MNLAVFDILQLSGIAKATAENSTPAVRQTPVGAKYPSSIAGFPASSASCRAPSAH